jgi:hypothetical protein
VDLGVAEFLDAIKWPNLTLPYQVGFGIFLAHKQQLAFTDCGADHIAVMRSEIWWTIFNMDYWEHFDETI